MQKRNLIRFAAIFLIALLFLMMNAQAEERIGNIIFQAIKKIEKRQEIFLSDIQQIRQGRENAMNQKEQFKRSLLQAKQGTVDYYEAHAELAYRLATVFKKYDEEIELVKNVARDHLDVLNGIVKEVSIAQNLTPEHTQKIIDYSKTLLKNSKDVISSLADFKDFITDPVINNKLTSASVTAKLISEYISQLENSQVNSNSAQKMLYVRLQELISQLNGLYAQTEVLSTMLKEKAKLLKMINSVAASEVALLLLSDGQQRIASIPEKIIIPIKSGLNETDTDLNMLIKGLSQSDSYSDENEKDQNWLHLQESLEE